MKSLIILYLLYSFTFQEQVKRERDIVYSGYPNMIEAIKTFRNESLLSVDVIFTSRNAMHPNINEFHTFFYGDSKQFYSWLLNLESLFERQQGYMKVFDNCDVYVKGDGRSKRLAVYKKAESSFTDISSEELEKLKLSFLKWCEKNKVIILNQKI